MRNFLCRAASSVLTAVSLTLIAVGACGVASAGVAPPVSCATLEIIVIPGPFPSPTPIPVCIDPDECFLPGWVCGPIWWRPIIGGEGGRIICMCAPEVVYPEPVAPEGRI